MRNLKIYCSMLICSPVFSAKLTAVRPVDKDIIQLTILDGEVKEHDDGLGAAAFTFANQTKKDTIIEYTPFLDVSQVGDVEKFHIYSGDDPFYKVALKPLAVYRKTKLNGQGLGAWIDSDFIHNDTYEHNLFIKLPQSMERDKGYSIVWGAELGIDQSGTSLIFNEEHYVSEALHVNLAGYHNDGSLKPADLYMWLGDGAGRNYSDFVGNTVWLMDVETKQKTEVAKVALWKEDSSDDLFWRDLTKAPVYKIDFNTAMPTGMYKLVVEGVGSSPAFPLSGNAYKQPFMVSVQGFYYMRIGEDSTAGIVPVPRRPLYIPGVSPANTTVYLTTMHPYHDEWNAFGSGDKWDVKEGWAAYVKPGNPTNPNAKGGHSDAADWDRHLGHVSIVYDMLLPVVLTKGAIDDDDLDIRESGNGVADIIDEAKNEVDFWLNLRDGVGYSHGLNNPTSANVFYQAAPTAVAAWANAANASMLAEAYRLTGHADLMAEYRDSALVAYQYASSLADQMLDNTEDVGVSVMRGRDFKMTAASYLYNLTGNPQYESEMLAELAISTDAEPLSDERNYNQIWAAVGYLFSPQTINDQSAYDLMKASLIRHALEDEVAVSKERASRRATPNGFSLGYFMANIFVHNSLIAHAILPEGAQKTQILEALLLEASYSLGRNGMNMIQMTTATTPLEYQRSVQGAYTTGRDDGSPGMHPGHTPYFNLDDWFCDMKMGCPSALYTNNYPSDFKETWPGDEAYHNTRYVWAHNEFTPQQTMRGKMALYGYLHGLATSDEAVKIQNLNPKSPEQEQGQIRVYDLRGKLVLQFVDTGAPIQNAMKNRGVSHGVYLYQLPGVAISHKIVLRD